MAPCAAQVVNVLHDDVELLDRRFSFVENTEGGAFVRELAQLLEVLEQDPRYATHLADLGREAEEGVKRLDGDDESLSAEADKLRARLIQFAPTLSDSSQPSEEDQDDSDCTATVAWFEKKLGETSFPPDTFTCEVETKAKALLNWVKTKAETTKLVDSVASRKFGDDLRADTQELKRLEAKFVDWKLTSAAVSLVAIKNFIFHALDSEGLSFEPGPMQTTFGFSIAIECAGWPDFDLRKPDPAPDTKAGRQLAREISAHRQHSKRVYEELRHRVGSRASMLSLFERFKNRCEWHDRERLASLVGKRASKQKRAQHEELLTAELRLWLFDKGLNPIATPQMGGLRPDVIDPTHGSNLYVEAKQYHRAEKGYLIKAFQQVWSTVATLQTSSYKVREAFLVIFRWGGPQYKLPPSVIGESWTTHILVIDIAEPSERGSRAPAVLCIDESALLHGVETALSHGRKARK